MGNRNIMRVWKYKIWCFKVHEILYRWFDYEL